MDAKFNFATLDKPFEASWPVKISMPRDGGKTEEEELVVKFRQLKTSQVQALMDSGEVKALGDMARHYFVGFGPGVEHPWSDEVRDQLLDLPNVRGAIERAYTQFTNGIEAKN